MSWVWDISTLCLKKSWLEEIMVEKLMVDKFMVEKLMVEKYGDEAWGWKNRGWNVLQPSLKSIRGTVKLAMSHLKTGKNWKNIWMRNTVKILVKFVWKVFQLKNLPGTLINTIFVKFVKSGCIPRTNMFMNITGRVFEKMSCQESKIYFFYICKYSLIH